MKSQAARVLIDIRTGFVKWTTGQSPHARGAGCMSDTRAFLGVACSALGQRWIGPDAARDRHAEAIWQATGLPPAVCAVLARAEVAPDGGTGLPRPSLRALLPDPRA